MRFVILKLYNCFYFFHSHKHLLSPLLGLWSHPAFHFHLDPSWSSPLFSSVSPNFNLRTTDKALQCWKCIWYTLEDNDHGPFKKEQGCSSVVWFWFWGINHSISYPAFEMDLIMVCNFIPHPSFRNFLFPQPDSLLSFIPHPAKPMLHSRFWQKKENRKVSGITLIYSY